MTAKSMIEYNENPCAWLFDTDLHEVSWLFATGRVASKFNWPNEDQCQRSPSNWVFVLIPRLECKYSHLILSKLSWKSTICLRRSPWLRIVLVRSLRSWLAKLVGVSVSSSVRNKFSSHPKTLELTGKCGVMYKTTSMENLSTGVLEKMKNNI